MAQEATGRREVVKDPLRQQQQGLQLAQLPIGLVRGPDRSSTAGFGQQQEELNRAMGGLQDALLGTFEENKDEWITEGKTAYMSGVTEQELMKNGNRFTQMGYLQLKARNDVNNWYLQEQGDLVSKSASMDPAAYQEYLSEKRKGYLDTIQDPYAKKVAVAAFEQLSPELAAKQFTQNNAVNYENLKSGARDFFRTGVMASPTSSRVIPGETALSVSPTEVEPAMALVGNDRDIGIKTLIGEAGNQGDLGMAAVAHTLRNRAVDSRYPNSIAKVALQKKQFSTWSLNSGYLNSLGPGNPVYDKAAKVFDTVMSGRHIDPTGGALFFHSPKGMEAYAASGVAVSQSTKNRLAAAEAGEHVRIGGHLFYGKSDGVGKQLRAAVEPLVNEEMGDTGGDTAYRDPMVSAPNYQKFPGKAADDLLPVTAGTPAATMLDAQNEQAQQNEGVTGVTNAGAPNEIMDFMQNYAGLKPEDKVDILSDEIASAFLAGSDQLFENAGGIAGLQKFGATADMIDKVVRARNRFEDEQDKKFDSEDLLFIDDQMREADKPGVDRKTILSNIDKYVKGRGLTDRQGISLATQALTKIRANEEKVADRAAIKQENEAERQAKFAAAPESNRDYLKEVGNLQQRIAWENLPQDEAQRMVDDIAARYGLNPEDTQKLIVETDKTWREKVDKTYRDAEARIKATAASDEARREVAKALGLGQGLATVTGTVKVVNQDGTTTSMTAKEFGIQQIKNEGIAQAMYSVQGDSAVNKATGVDPAKVAAYVFPKLQAHDVIDPETKAQFISGMAGNIMVKNEKGQPVVTETAKSAYNLYTMLRRNNTINSGWLATQVGDDYTRSVLEQAYSLDGGNLTGTEALVRAKDMIDNKEIDPAYKGRADKALDDALEGQGEAFVRERLAGSWGDWFSTPGETVDTAVTIDSRALQDALRTRALRYRDLNPWQTPEAAINLAKQDLTRDTKRVAGNLVITSNKLEQLAGLETPDHLDRAMSRYLAENAETLFGAEAAAAWKTMAVNPLMPAKAPYGIGNPPPVKLMWIPSMQQFMAWRVTDTETGEVDLGHRALIDPKVVGNDYKDYQKQPGVLSGFKDLFRKNIVEDWKKPREAAPEGSGWFGIPDAIRASTKDFRDNLQETERSLGSETQGRPAN